MLTITAKNLILDTKDFFFTFNVKTLISLEANAFHLNHMTWFMKQSYYIHRRRMNAMCRRLLCNLHNSFSLYFFLRNVTEWNFYECEAKWRKLIFHKHYYIRSNFPFPPLLSFHHSTMTTRRNLSLAINGSTTKRQHPEKAKFDYISITIKTMKSICSLNVISFLMWNNFFYFKKHYRRFPLTFDYIGSNWLISNLQIPHIFVFYSEW